jgi:hypothetical protein
VAPNINEVDYAANVDEPVLECLAGTLFPPFLQHPFGAKFCGISHFDPGLAKLKTTRDAI